MKKMLLFIALFLAGCSATDIAGTAIGAMTGGDKGIDATAQIGKENTETNGVSLVKDERKDVTADDVEGDLNVVHDTVNEYNVPWWALAIAVIAGIFVESETISKFLFSLKRLIFTKENK